MEPIERLKRLLRPAGGGIYTVSTGTKDQLKIQRRIYGASTDEGIKARWHGTLERIRDARVVILGVPSDVGAGFERGASFGPQSIRRELVRRASWVYADARIVDAGDVFCVPQLLHDEMLTSAQIEASRRAIYGDDAGAHAWPVSPLSITEAAIRAIREVAPRAIPLVLGGDHSVGWPVLAAIAHGREKDVGILHFDAHTDLLEARLGVRYCFATWAYHANDLIGRGRRLNQVGLRISRFTREHWESTLGVRQYWMKEILERPIEDIGREIADNMRAAGCKGLYISNDIDGTDPLFALATGTPEPSGMHPDSVGALIDQVGAALPVWGSDLVEVAPRLGAHSPREPASTLATAAHYVERQAAASLAAP